MPCFYPQQAFRSTQINPKTGKRSITFVRNRALNPNSNLTLPCRNCCGCRLEYSRQWAIRCYHEASLYEDNCFVTLTYNDDNLPYGGSLLKADVQKFMKRLRKKYPQKIRYFYCGEYGDKLSRPHYHLCLFNHSFPDIKIWQPASKNKEALYRSPSLEALWSNPDTGQSMGHSSVGNLTFQSAAYTARYVLKKINGDLAADHYCNVDQLTGEIFDLLPEYTDMSRRPGIASPWLKRYQADVYPHDYVVINNRKVKPPKFYDTSYEIINPADFKLLKSIRKQSSRAHLDNNTPERLQVREKIQLINMQRLMRTLE